MFTCKQLNEPVLESLKPNQSGPKFEKKKSVKPSPGQNFVIFFFFFSAFQFLFRLEKAWTKIFFFTLGRLGLKNLACADL